jgi:hypothetical protein
VQLLSKPREKQLETSYGPLLMPKLAQRPLTELAIKKAKPEDKRYDLFDASVRGWA